MSITRTFMPLVVAATLLAGSWPLRADAAMLLQQLPSSAPDAVVVGSDGQALVPAESFTIHQTAHRLSWWGSFGVDFALQIYALSDLSAPLLAYTPSFAGLQRTSVQSIDGVERDIFRFDLDLGALPAGSYAVSIAELTTDASIVDTWYWARGLSGDGASLFGLGDPGGGSFDFDLSLRLDAATPGLLPLPPTLSLALLTMLAAGAATSHRRRRRAAQAG